MSSNDGHVTRARIWVILGRVLLDHHLQDLLLLLGRGPRVLADVRRLDDMLPDFKNRGHVGVGGCSLLVGNC